ncbi:MAG TPA: M56 family metallopeptidase [Longimicrobiaceae bacterium]
MDAATGPLAAAPAADAVAWWRDLSTVLGLAWLASSLAVLGAVAWTYRRLRAVRAGSVPMELDGTAVRVAERTGPAVVGLLRPAVVVPRWTLDLPAEERSLILLHEREHVAHGDPWLLFLGTLAVAAMPWSLPLWWQHRRLRSATEADCDARVLARGANRRDYGRVLIRTAGCAPVLPLLGPAWGDSTSQLERRIMTMTAKRPTHRLLRSLPLLALAAGVIVAACDVAGEGGPAALPVTEAAASAPVAPSPKVDTLVDTVTVPQRPGPRSKSSIGMRPAFPVRFDTTVAKPRIRTVEHFRVGEMDADGGAARAGVRPGDVILTVNGLDSREHGNWMSLKQQRPGTRYVLRIRRGSEEREITAYLDPLSSWF